MNQNQSGITVTSILTDRHEAAHLHSATSGVPGFRFAVTRDARDAIVRYQSRSPRFCRGSARIISSFQPAPARFPAQ